MPTATVPNSFTTGTPVIATAWNENFTALLAWLNTYGIQKDASVAFTALPTIPTTTPSVDGHVASRKFVNDTYRGKGDLVVTFSVTPGGNVDTTTSGSEADWITLIASQPIPSWANKCYFDVLVSGWVLPSSSFSNLLVKNIVGTIECGAAYVTESVLNARQTLLITGEGTVTSVAGTSVAIKLRSIDDAGAGVMRVDTTSRLTGYLRFFA